MKDLGKDARELLDAAAMVSMAPHAVRLRARKRLLSAVTVGSISTTTLVAKGSWVGAPATASGAGAASTVSLSTTLVSAVMIGLSSGLVAISPASTTETPRPRIGEAQPPSTQPRSAQPSPSLRKVTSVPQLDSTPVPSSAPAATSSNLAPLEAPIPATEPVQGAILPSPMPSTRLGAPRAPGAQDAPSPPNGTTATAPEYPLDSVLPSAPINSSIARETELLAQVQRAIKGGRALMAIYLLDSYREEFPSGKLQEEAAASRVVALCALGRREEARRSADVFTRNYPSSPLRERVRSACQKPASGSDAQSE